jgi:two-component sensor histidine kinase
MDSQDLKTFDIAPFLRELSTNILAGSAMEKINLSVRSVSLNAGLDFAIPLALLVTELVSNALKHAFPDGQGTVEVSLDRADDGAVVLVVSDNGVGHDEAKTLKTGLGTRIIKGLVAQMGGTIAVKSDHGTRSEVRIAAPVLA